MATSAEDRLQALIDQLRTPRGRRRRWGNDPCEVATELREAIEITIVDDLWPTYRRLERAARVTF